MKGFLYIENDTLTIKYTYIDKGEYLTYYYPVENRNDESLIDYIGHEVNFKLDVHHLEAFVNI